ncbi:unnamed protein product [Rotaria sp. Silwood1]|nr:unnamed protein product [Rotaria sp. Silwood1]CAF1398487.1 unnamed protein product [Rotaria sp. Silwood1]CAF3580379.1 unnamed protein product [Rotaria sp. Silwood1]CAF4827739.1 unnamed protein product [Rotaria sp. Silwood1]
MIVCFLNEIEKTHKVFFESTLSFSHIDLFLDTQMSQNPRHNCGKSNEQQHSAHSEWSPSTDNRNNQYSWYKFDKEAKEF